jgi:hypothetical protein
VAVQVAAFQEDAGTDAWSIVDGEALDVEDLTMHRKFHVALKRAAILMEIFYHTS